MATESLILEYDFKDNASQKTNEFTNKLNKLANSMGITSKNMSKIDSASKKVKDSFNKVTSSVSNLFKKMTSLKGLLAGTAVVMAAMKLKSWATSWINLSNVQQEAELQLKNTMKSMGVYTDQYYNSMLKTATALQKVTEYGDEAILAVQNRLVAFGNVSEEIMPRVTSLTLDLAKALKIDLKRAAELMGKALGGDITMLKTKGINVSKGMSTKELLDAIEGSAGGAASVDSWTKAWISLGNVIGDLKEAFGDFFNIILVDSGFVDSLTTSIGNLTDSVKEFIKQPFVKTMLETTLDSVTNKVDKLSEDLKKVEDSDVKKKLDSVGNTLTWISRILKGMAFTYLIKMLITFYGWLNKTFTLFSSISDFVIGKSKAFMKWSIHLGGISKVIEKLNKYKLPGTTVPTGLTVMEKIWMNIGKIISTASSNVAIIGAVLASPTIYALLTRKGTEESRSKISKEYGLDTPTNIPDGWLNNMDSFNDKLNLTNDVGDDILNTWEKIKSLFKIDTEFIDSFNTIEDYTLKIGMTWKDIIGYVEEDYNFLKKIEKEFAEYVKDSWSKTIVSITSSFNKAFSGMLQGNKLDFGKFTKDIIGLFSKNVTDMISGELIKKVVEPMVEGIIQKHFGKEFMEEATVDDIIKRFKKAIPAIDKEVKTALNKLQIERDLPKLEFLLPHGKDPEPMYIKPIFLEPELAMVTIEPDMQKVGDALEDLSNYKEWEDFSDKLASTIRDSIKEGLRTGLMDRGQLRKNIRGLFTDKLADEFSKNLETGISKFMNIDTGIPIGDDKTMSMGTAVGVGSGLYNMQQNKEQLGVAGGAMSGASIGSAFGPWGAAVGAIGGGLYGAASEPAKKSVKLMFKEIDGQMELISKEFKGQKGSASAIDAAKKAVDSAYDFYNKLRWATGDTSKFSISASGEESASLSKSGLFTSMAPMIYKSFGEDFVKTINDYIIPTIKTETISFIKGPKSPWDLKDLEAARLPTDRAGIEYGYGTKQGKDLRYTKTVKETLTDVEAALQNEDYSTIAEHLTSGTMESIMEIYGEKFQELANLVAGSINNGFAAAIKTKDFKLFFSTVKSNLAQSLVSTISGAVTDTLYQKLLPTLGDMPGLIDKFTSGDMSIEDLTAEVSTNFAKSSQIIANMEPVFNAVANGLSTLTDVIDENTESNWENNRLMVDELLSRKEMIEDFIRDMRGGDQAPTRSIDWMEQEYESLLSGAMKGDSDDLSKLLDYVSGTYLPFMETASSNYDDTFEKVMDEIEAMTPSDELLSKELQTLIDMLSELDDQTELMQEYVDILKGIKGEAIEGSPEDITRKGIEEATTSREEQQDWAKLYIEDQKANGVGQNFRSFVAEQKELNSQPLHIHLDVDGREIASVLVNQANTNPDMQKLLGGR